MVVDQPCVVLQYAPLFLHYSVYVPEMTTLSVKSLGFRSLGIQPDNRKTLCSRCHATLSKQCTIVEYPSYLVFNINRTFFDIQTYQSQKDCTMVQIDHMISIDHVGETTDGHF